MMDINQIESEIEVFVANLFHNLGIDAVIKVDQQGFNEEKNLHYILVSLDVDEDEAPNVIGYHGTRLDSFSNIISMLNLDTELRFSVIFDVNGYRKRREERVVEIAANAAKEAIETSTEVVLSPMKPWERRVIHNHLSDRTDVSSSSIGEGEDRKVVIKPESVV